MSVCGKIAVYPKTESVANKTEPRSCVNVEVDVLGPNSPYSLCAGRKPRNTESANPTQYATATATIPSADSVCRPARRTSQPWE